MSLRALLIVVCALTCSAVAQDDATSVHTRLSRQFSGATSLRVVATSSAMMGTKLRVSAKRPDKFMVELSDRTIVCNGITVWNYTPSRKSVVISKYNSKTSTLSVDKILLDVIVKYKPTNLKSENSSALGSCYLLNLDPEGNELYGVKNIVVTVSKKNLQLKKVSITTAQGKQDWTVQSLQTNVKLDDTQFTFTPPKNVEVVDLRD